jgi:DNA invertase Pin-like site-specific DNA recombinase
VEVVGDRGLLLVLRDIIRSSTALPRLQQRSEEGAASNILADRQRELLHEGAAAARAAAKARGRHTGRPPKLTAAQARQVRALRERGESTSDLVAGYDVSRATIYRALNAAETAPG